MHAGRYVALFAQRQHRAAIHPARPARDIGADIGSGINLSWRAAGRRGACDTRPYTRHIIARFIRQPAITPKVILKAARPGIISRQEGRGAVKLIHFADISRTRLEVIIGVIGVRPQIVALGQFAVGAGHHLHQPHGTHAGCRTGAAPAFLAHHFADPKVRHIKAAGGIADPWPPGIIGWARRGGAVRTVIEGPIGVARATIGAC